MSAGDDAHAWVLEAVDLYELPLARYARRLLGDVDLAAAAVTGLKVLDGIEAQVHEKNWMPVEGRGGWIYACCHGGHVLTVDADPDLAGGWQLARRSPAPLGTKLVPQLQPVREEFLPGLLVGIRHMSG